MRRDRLTPEEIIVGDRLRSRLDETTVLRLMESMSSLGLQSPIAVRYANDTDDNPFLVAGLHRLEAAKRLDWPLIDCVFFEDETTARMWEVAENLHRADLTALERDEHIAEWIRLADRVSSQVGTKLPVGRPESGVRRAAREIGVSKNDAHRATKVDGLSAEAKAAARGAGLDDNRSALLRAAAAPDPALQLQRIRDEQAKIEAHKANRQTDRMIALTEAQQYAACLRDRFSVAELPVLIAWIEGTKPKDVVAALRREAA
jgi:hypothetical protein